MAINDIKDDLAVIKSYLQAEITILNALGNLWALAKDENKLTTIINVKDDLEVLVTMLQSHLD